MFGDLPGEPLTLMGSGVTALKLVGSEGVPIWQEPQMSGCVLHPMYRVLRDQGTCPQYS